MFKSVFIFPALLLYLPAGSMAAADTVPAPAAAPAALAAPAAETATGGGRAAATNTVVLDEQAVKNLRIETVEAEETIFEETIFALGRIETVPGKGAVVSSRIPGRLVEIKAIAGDTVAAGAEVARLESRQPGDPPPSILLRAPLGGLVLESQMRLGEPVEPDKTLMFLADLTEVHAVAHLPEQFAGRIGPGTQAHIRVAALPEEKFEGELIRFGTTVNREAGTIDAIFRLPNPGLTLRPGMRAEFSIVLSKREGVMSIPRAALQGDALSRFVYVEDFELPNAFVKSPVVVGAQNDRFVEIASGLLPGDKVVTRGAYSLAFAGKGSISLKEALDAAHGHEHAEDGSELTEQERAARRHRAAGEHEGAHGHGHGHGAGKLGPLTIFSLAVNALLLVLLAASVRRKPAAVADDAPPRPTDLEKRTRP